MNALLRSHRIPAILSLLFTTAIVWFIYKQQLDRVYLLLAVIPALLLLKVLLFGKVWLVYSLLFLTPLSISLELGGGFAASFPSEPLLALIGGVFILTILLKPTIEKKILYHPITIFLIVDTLWLMVASINSTIPEISVKRVVMRFLFILICYLLFSHWFKERKNISKAILLYCFGLLPVILITLNKHAAWDFVTSVSFNIPQPYYADHTVYGASIAFVIPFLVILWWRHRDFKLPNWQRWIVGIVLFIFVVGEILSYSRASWLSLFAAAAFALLLHWKIRLRAIVIGLGILGGVLIVSGEAIYESIEQNEAISNQGDITEHFQSVTNLSTDASNLERINRWTSAWLMFQERPITGFGPGTYQYEYVKYQLTHMKTYISTNHGNRGNAHSEYLTYLSETGLPGLISFFILILATLATGMRVIYRSKDRLIRMIATGILLGLVTFFVHGLFNSFIDQDKIAVLVFCAMAGLAALEVFHLNPPTTETSE